MQLYLIMSIYLGLVSLNQFSAKPCHFDESLEESFCLSRAKDSSLRRLHSE